MSELHNQIMNLPCIPDDSAGINHVLAFKLGHKQARHAAAEIAANFDNQRDELLAALKASKKALENANESNPSPICDTIWYSKHETLFDFMDAAIEKAEA